MPTYWLNYRIADMRTNRRSPERRHEAMTNAIRHMSDRWWVESNAFIVFDAAPEIDAVTGKLVEALDPDHDLVLISDLHHSTARIWGAYEDQDVFAFLPNLKPFTGS